MGVTTEEARAKLSLDVSTLDGAKRNIQQFSEHAHHSFLHAGTPARAFHKLLEGITEQSQVAGRAIAIAISPLAGILTSAAAGFAFINRQLEEFNKHLDQVRDNANKPVTNRDAINDAIRNRSSSVSQGAREFERKERGKVPLLSGLTELEQVVLQGMPEGPGREAMERSFLGAARGRLHAELGKTQLGLESERSAVGDPKLQSAIETRKQLLARAKTEIEDLERRRGELQEKAATPTAGTMTLKEWALGFAGFATGRNDLTSRIDTDADERANANKELERLQKLKGEEKKLQDQLRELTEYDKLHNNELKNKEEAVSKLIEGIRELDKEYGKIPAAAPNGNPMIAPTIDPVTGGIAYRPIKDTGGIKFKGLPGGLGTEQVIDTAPHNLAANDPLILLNQKMQLLVDAAVKDGLILKLPE